MTWLINPFRFGSAPTGEHTQWRVVGLNSDGAFLTFPEVIFAATPGGSDIAGGTIISSSPGTATRLPSFANDGLLSSVYEHGGTNSTLLAGSWWGKTYPTPVAPVEVRLGGATGGAGPTSYSVRSVTVQRSDDGVTWTSVAMGLLSSPTSGNYRTFSFDPAAVMPANEIRAWRVKGTASQLGEYNCASLMFAATAGGANLALTSLGCQAGSGCRLYISGIGGPPSALIDGVGTVGMYQNFYTANNWPDGSMCVYFPAHTDAAECRMKATSDYPTGMFSNFTIDKSHDGVAWTTMRTVTGNTGVTAGQIRTWSIP